MKYIVKLNEEDRNKIEKLHYQVEARANLLDRLMQKTVSVSNADDAIEGYMGEYEKYYVEYVKLRDMLENKYKPDEIKDTAKSWEIVFESSEMIFEV